MLFDPAQHEEVTGEPWDEQRVRAAVREIVADAEGAFDPETWWPVHARDEDYAGLDVYATHGLWSGAAGVLWALLYLAEQGAVVLENDYTSAAGRLHGDFLRLAGGEAPAVPGLWCGEAGILLVSYLAAPLPATADRLFAAVRANEQNETRELVWGSPGTMLAARAMLERTGDERWRELWLDSARWLWDEWRRDGAHDCFLWTQQLYGSTVSYFGPAHGFAGNVAALAQLLPPDRCDELAIRAGDAVSRLAYREDGLVNWAPLAGGELEANGTIRLQWCHGAPGIVTSLAGIAGDEKLDQLLLGGGELTWLAGPLAKGPGLCHGTAGNGFALLTLYRRTGDQLWLARARAFAVHALQQVDRSRVADGRGRFSLWTGDLGAALFAWQCIAGDAAFPTVDAW